MSKKVKFMDVLKYIWTSFFKRKEKSNVCSFDECICKLEDVRKKLEDLPINN